MTWWVWGLLIAAYSLVVFVAGERYGNRMEEDAWKELQSLRGRLAAQIKGKG